MKTIIYKILKEEFDIKNYGVIFVGGLDTGTYKNLPTQESLVLNGLGNDIKIISFSHSSPVTKILSTIKNNPDDYVLLFSAGCKYSDIISTTMEDPTKLYIVEPYSSEKNIIKVNKAEELGANVYVGDSASVGKGISPGSVSTPNCASSREKHWCALTSIARIIRNRINSTK